MVNVEEALGASRDSPLSSNLTGWVKLTFIDYTVLVLIVLVELYVGAVNHSMNLELPDIIFALSIDLVILNL